ncbi:MAG: hypothetical protein VW684_12670, partial [Betaproteobacteria bacterium]
MFLPLFNRVQVALVFTSLALLNTGCGGGGGGASGGGGGGGASGVSYVRTDDFAQPVSAGSY